MPSVGPQWGLGLGHPSQASLLKERIQRVAPRPRGLYVSNKLSRPRKVLSFKLTLFSILQMLTPPRPKSFLSPFIPSQFPPSSAETFPSTCIRQRLPNLDTEQQFTESSAPPGREYPQSGQIPAAITLRSLGSGFFVGVSKVLTSHMSPGCSRGRTGALECFFMGTWASHHHFTIETKIAAY